MAFLRIFHSHRETCTHSLRSRIKPLTLSGSPYTHPLTPTNFCNKQQPATPISSIVRFAWVASVFIRVDNTFWCILYHLNISLLGTNSDNSKKYDIVLELNSKREYIGWLVCIVDHPHRNPPLPPGTHRHCIV